MAGLIRVICDGEQLGGGWQQLGPTVPSETTLVLITNTHPRIARAWLALAGVRMAREEEGEGEEDCTVLVLVERSGGPAAIVPQYECLVESSTDGNGGTVATRATVKKGTVRTVGGGIN